MSPREALLAAARGRSADAMVVVPAGWLLEALAAPAAPAQVDLPCAAVAQLVGRSKASITAWCRAGLLPGSYLLRSREWRIPPSALASLQRHEQERHERDYLSQGTPNDA